MADNKGEKFPKSLLITRHQEEDESESEPYFLAHESKDDLSADDQEGEMVAVYELKEVTRMKVTKTLEPL